MTTTARLTNAELQLLQITPKTVWAFLRLEADDGRVGWGEATIPNDVSGLSQAAAAWVPALRGEPATPALADRFRRTGAP